MARVVAGDLARRHRAARRDCAWRQRRDRPIAPRNGSDTDGCVVGQVDVALYAWDRW